MVVGHGGRSCDTQAPSKRVGSVVGARTSYLASEAISSMSLYKECVCARVRACVRACVCVCACVCVQGVRIHGFRTWMPALCVFNFGISALSTMYILEPTTHRHTHRDTHTHTHTETALRIHHRFSLASCSRTMPM